MHVPLSVADELRYLLAPSKHLDETSFVQVIAAVFLQRYISGVVPEVGAINKIMFSNPETSSSATSNLTTSYTNKWYYFRADLVQAKLKITWYKAINEAMASVESHKEFLYPHLSLICGERNYTC